MQDGQAAAPLWGAVAVPLYLFSVSLVLLLTLSWFVVLPQFTRFQVGAQILNATDLVRYRSSLEAKVHTLESKRDALLLPAHDPVYTALRDARAEQPTPVELRQELLSIAAASTGKPDAVVIGRIAVDLDAETMHIEGIVQHAGFQSMTLLAQYVEALQAAPFVESLTPPTFTREEGPAGVFHSPFSLDITLKQLPSS